MCLSFFLTPFLKPIGINLVKKWEGKGENLNWNKTVNNHHQQKRKKCTQNIPFLMRMHDCTHASIHINSLHRLSMMRKRMVKKERSLIETWFFFMHKTTKEKLQNSTIKLTVEPQKGPKTAEQSTQNVALYEINAR